MKRSSMLLISFLKQLLSTSKKLLHLSPLLNVFLGEGTVLHRVLVAEWGT